MRSSLGISCLALLLFSSCGGGGGNYDGPVGQVNGIVKLGDAPLTESASITFMSKEGHVASATLSGSGEYKMKCNGSNSIPVGTYRVAVIPNLPAEPARQDPASFFNKDGSTKVVKTVISKIPEKYRQPGSSGIDIVVKEGNQTLPIDLDLK
jgi:hypothetical protein